MTSPTTEAVIEAVARALRSKHGIPDAEDVAQTAISAHLKALEAEGMVIVPAEPTQDMVRSGHDWTEVQFDLIADTYRAMIAAYKGK